MEESLEGSDWWLGPQKKGIPRLVASLLARNDDKGIGIPPRLVASLLARNDGRIMWDYVIPSEVEGSLFIAPHLLGMTG